MGSENSKSDDEQKKQRNQTKNIRPKLYTEDEIQRALENQKRMFENKQSQMGGSSGIYPNLETQYLNMNTTPITSNAVHYSVTPSAPPKNVLYSAKNTTVARQTYQQNETAQPSISFQRSAELSSAHISYQNTTSVGPSHTTLSSAGPSHARVFAGPSHVTLSSAGPSHDAQNNKNQKQFKTPRPRSRSRCNQDEIKYKSIVNCVTCNGELCLHIYQCTNGHSSCNGCRFKNAQCGNCSAPITDMRNITLESTLADMSINNEDRVKCPNAKDGCVLNFNRIELQNHLKECPFNIIPCPVMEFSGDCNWRGMIKQFLAHFKDAHPKHLEAEVDKEMDILLIGANYRVMNLVTMGSHKFLVHIKVDTSLNNIYMVTQHLGTNFSASKWTYEWHVYNKKEPRRKFEYIDICKSNATPVSEILESHKCAVINLDYAKTFLTYAKLTFKFYIKKQFNN